MTRAPNAPRRKKVPVALLLPLGIPAALHSAWAGQSRVRCLPPRTEHLRKLEKAEVITYRSSDPSSEGHFKRSLQELELNKRPDGAWRAGKEWDGVWTRDISYSIDLGLGALDPQAAKRSLLSKVKNGKIIQDTGTGGSWPVSTDRMTWSLGAWEVYTATGDREWLKQSYKIIRDSMETDLKTIYDSRTGLVRGEQSFLDWRKQSYPIHFESADIYNSFALGTNAVHYRSHWILEQMAELLGDHAAAARHRADAQRLKAAINKHLWLKDKGYYSQYLYGQFPTPSDKSETLGEALTVLFGIADDNQARKIIERMPVQSFGATSFYPQNPGVPSYHNNSVWPFVVGYHMRAAAKTKNEEGVNLAIRSIRKAAERYGTNKENFEAVTLSPTATAVNSDRQLWSVAANLAIVQRVFLGMDFQKNALQFAPFIPRAHAGTHAITGFKYGDALLDIQVSGWGEGIKSIQLDGKELSKAEIPMGIQGQHQIKIVMNERMPPAKINLVENRFAPPAPAVNLQGENISWAPVPGAVHYEVLRNGKKIAALQNTQFKITPGDSLGLYEVRAIDEHGWSSFSSKPIRVAKNTQLVHAVGQRADEAQNFVVTTQALNPSVAYSVKTDKPGDYILDALYSNGEGGIEGNGPLGNKAAIRSLYVDGKRVDNLVMPQRGMDDWADKGYSNPVRVHLGPGLHRVELRYTPLDENMNGEVNKAHIHHLRVTQAE